MDVQMHLLGGSMRRVPMNQDEFDTKFNFLKGSRIRHLSLEDFGSNGAPRAMQLCGYCCMGGSGSNDHDSETHRLRNTTTAFSRGASTRFSIDHQPTGIPQRHAASVRSGGGLPATTTLIRPRYELSFGADGEEDPTDGNAGHKDFRSSAYFTSYFPLIECLQRYRFRDDFLSDFIAGISLGLHCAAEGFAMAFLTGLPPIYGLYTTFCASFIYLFFGTSHLSVMVIVRRLGSNALVCFMMRNVIERHSTPYDYAYFVDGQPSLRRVGVRDTSISWQKISSPLNAAFVEQPVEKINLLMNGDDQLLQLAATVSFLCAFFYGVIYAFRFDFIFSYLSEHLLNGFSLGIAIRIVFNQLQHILNVTARFCDAETTANKSLSPPIPPRTTPSYLYCVLWAAYRRIYGLNQSASAVAEESSSVSPAYLSFREAEKPSEDSASGKHCVPSTVWDCLESMKVETLALSVFAILSLLLARQFFGPSLRFRRFRFALPYEFALMVVAAFLARVFYADRHNLEVVKYISEQFKCTFPRVGLFGAVGVDALAIALLAFALHIRLVNALARKQASVSAVDERQELFSYMMMGAISSLVAAHPIGASAARARIAENAGAKSVILNVSLVLTLLPIAIWWTTFMRMLPVCILSCVVLTSVCAHFHGVSTLRLLWSVSRPDVFTFGFAALVALFHSNVSHALIAAVVFGATTVVLRTQWPSVQLLVNVTGSGAYYAEKRFYGSELEESGVAVMRYEAPLLFNNAAHFCASAHRVAASIKGQMLGIGIGTRAGSMKSMKSMAAASAIVPMATGTGGCGGGGGGGNGAGSTANLSGGGGGCAAAAAARDFFSNTRSTLLISGDVVPNYDAAAMLDQPHMSRVLIVDCSAMATIDATGVASLTELYEALARRQRCRLLLAAVNAACRERFRLCGGYDTVAKSMFFPSVHDAVLYSQQLGGIIAPSIHMSVSLNGCRDLIALSAATSNLDMAGGGGQQNPTWAGDGGAAAGTSSAQPERPQSGGASVTNLTIGSGGGGGRHHHSHVQRQCSTSTAPPCGNLSLHGGGGDGSVDGVSMPSPSLSQQSSTTVNGSSKLKLAARQSINS